MPSFFNNTSMLLTGTAAALLSLSGGIVCAAEGWPSRPIHLIIPFPPGSGNDIVGRWVGGKLAERIGRNVVVDNRGGAAGTIGTAIAVNALPDGQTLLLISVAHAYSASLRKVPFHPIKSITPVAMLGSATNALATHPSVPAKSVKELIALAKAQPGRLNYASAGTGSFSHLSAELLRTFAGFDAVHVPFTGGGPAMVAMVGGQTHYIIGSLIQTLPFVQSGKLRALGVGSARRNSALPDVPTIAETLPGYEASNWWGVVGPAGMPPAVVKRVSGEISAIIAAPETRGWLTSRGGEAIDMTPAQFHKWISAEMAKWSRVVKNTGIRDE